MGGDSWSCGLEEACRGLFSVQGTHVGVGYVGLHGAVGVTRGGPRIAESKEENGYIRVLRAAGYDGEGSGRTAWLAASSLWRLFSYFSTSFKPGAAQDPEPSNRSSQPGG